MSCRVVRVSVEKLHLVATSGAGAAKRCSFLHARALLSFLQSTLSFVPL